MRSILILATVLAVAACQQPAPPKADASPPSAQTTAPSAPAQPAGVAYTPDPADADGDAEFRGPMTMQESGGAGADKRFRFTWMDGKHTVIASVSGEADPKTVIDRDEAGKPITLGQALGVKAGQTITLLSVEDESGPGPGDPNYTPLCGIRMVTDIAMLRSAEGVALATSQGAFGAPGANGCSNSMWYKKAS